jgi:alpha-glucosidase (family GH31 glycosyl hydrolase)
MESLIIFSEFLLGDSVLIAPVLEEGAVTRDIYLPSGRWEDQVQEGQVHEGPIWLRDYRAPLDTLPYFLKL